MQVKIYFKNNNIKQYNHIDTIELESGDLKLIQTTSYTLEQKIYRACDIEQLTVRYLED